MPSSHSQEYETNLQSYETQVEQMEAICRSGGAPFRHLISRLEEMLEKWDRLWTLAHLYVERLKSCEAFLSRIDEADQIVCDIELLLVSHRKLPPSQEDMKRIMKEIKVRSFLNVRLEGSLSPGSLSALSHETKSA